MFTGIIENIGKVEAITTNGTNKTFWISCAISNELKVDQSVSHNGVCLTVEEIAGNKHRVTAIEETLLKTNLNNWQIGDVINVERCMLMNGRIDGHIVQGHVDAIAVCIAKKDLNGSTEFVFEFDKQFAELIIEKGSVAVNGISLTCFNVTDNSFTVAIIPYTMLHTNMHSVEVETTVNIEFDVIGKYVQRRKSIDDGR
jgi:riboflavin synthase